MIILSFIIINNYCIFVLFFNVLKSVKLCLPKGLRFGLAVLVGEIAPLTASSVKHATGGFT